MEDGGEPSGTTKQIISLLLGGEYSREELYAAIHDAEIPSGTQKNRLTYSWRDDREAYLKLGTELAADEDGRILYHLINCGNPLLITAPIIELLRFDEANDATQIPEIMYGACSSCFGLFIRDKNEQMEEEDKEDRYQQHLWTCGAMMRALDGTEAVQMIDWDFLLMELQHLLDVGEEMHRTDYICRDSEICEYLMKWNPQFVVPLMHAILMNRRPIQETSAHLFMEHIEMFLRDGYDIVSAGFAQIFETTLAGVPTYQQYTSLKRMLLPLNQFGEEREEKYKKTKKLFYGAKLGHEALLANRLLVAAYIYEVKQDWLPAALSFIDSRWINIRALGGFLMASSNTETEEIREQRLRLVYTLLNSVKWIGADPEIMRRIEWIMFALNEEVDRRLGTRRDLNLFYLPSPPNKKNLLERENVKSMSGLFFDFIRSRKEEGESLICVDKNFVHLEPRAQAAANPKDIAKLVSPHKLGEEVDKTERVNKLIIPRMPCFHCEEGFIDISKSSDKTTFLGEAGAIWSYSRSFTEMEYRPTESGVEVRPVTPTWRSAGQSKEGADRIDFDDEMCRVLEKARSDKDDVVMCKIAYQSIARAVPDPKISASQQAQGTEADSVQIEVNLKHMHVVDRVNMTVRELYRTVNEKMAEPALEPTKSGSLSLRPPSTPTKNKVSGELVKCWVCFGSGYISRWFNEEVAKISGSPTLSMKRRISADDVTQGSMVDEHGAMCPICYCDPGIYGMSVECDHLFCRDCAHSSLAAILESGQFPANCPMCRAEGKIPDPDGNNTEAVGLISRPVLTFLAERDVIDKKFQFRFVNAMRRYNNSYLHENKDQFMACPRKGCDTYLYVPVLNTDKEDDDVALEGQCPCGQVVCLLCHEPVVQLPKPRMIDGEVKTRFHECPKLTKKQQERKERIKKANLEPDVALLAQFGKKCPACSMFIEKNEGCDVMMCGDTAHGNLRKALTNGGCGLAFNWNSLKPQEDGYNDVNGERKHGFVITARMKKSHPKCARSGCTYYKSTDNLTTDLVKNPGNNKNNGGDYCCEDCKNGKKTHHKCCHKIVHPDCIDKFNPTLSRDVFIKAGDLCVKWFVPFRARLIQVKFDSSHQPPIKYGGSTFKDMLKAMAPTHFKQKDGSGFQFGMEVIGNDGKPLVCKAAYTHNLCVSRHHSSLMPTSVPYKIDIDRDPIYPAGVQMNASGTRHEKTQHNFFMSLRYGAPASNDNFSILFDLGEPCLIVGLRSILLSHYAFTVSHATLSAEEASSAKHFFRDYKVANQTVVFDPDSIVVDDKDKKGGKKLEKKKSSPQPKGNPPRPPPPGGGRFLRKANPEPPNPLAEQGEGKIGDTEPTTLEERRMAYQLIAEERAMIMQTLGDTCCECPACGTLIVKNGGDDNLMCGCEAKAAGGTMAKALAGGGCGLQFNFKTLQPIADGAPGKPANDRQWRYAK